MRRWPARRTAVGGGKGLLGRGNISRRRGEGGVGVRRSSEVETTAGAAMSDVLVAI